MEELNQVPQHAIKDFLLIRDSGKLNMFDGKGVLLELINLECYDTVEWLSNVEYGEISCNFKLYSKLLNAVSEHLKTNKN